MEKEITWRQALDYEIHSSPWAGRASNRFIQKLMGKYFAWKVRRKMKKYKASKKFERLVKGVIQIEALHRTIST